MKINVIWYKIMWENKVKPDRPHRWQYITVQNGRDLLPDDKSKNTEIILNTYSFMWAGQLSRYNDGLRAGRTGDRIPVGARFLAPVQTGPGAHPTPFTMGSGSFPRAKSGWGVTLNTHALLVPWLWKSRALPLLPLWAVRPVQSLSACTRVHFNLQ
jgi:hypothetical protein